MFRRRVSISGRLRKGGGMIADRRGVTALEYAMIASAMALVLAAIFTALGPVIGNPISQVAQRL